MDLSGLRDCRNVAIAAIKIDRFYKGKTEEDL